MNKKEINIIKFMVRRDLLIQYRNKYEFVFGVAMLPSWIGVLIVLSISLLFMREHITVSMGIKEILLFLIIIFLSSITSVSLELLVGTIFKPNQISAMFPGF